MPLEGSSSLFKQFWLASEGFGSQLSFSFSICIRKSAWVCHGSRQQVIWPLWTAQWQLAGMLPAPFSTISAPTTPDSMKFTNLGAISLDSLDSLDSLIHARLFRASVLSFIIARMAPMTLTTAFFCSWAKVGMLRSTSSRTGLGPISSNHVPSWSFIVTCCLTPSCPIHAHSTVWCFGWIPCQGSASCRAWWGSIWSVLGRKEPILTGLAFTHIAQ